jgi:hypothetical protein
MANLDEHFPGCGLRRRRFKPGATVQAVNGQGAQSLPPISGLTRFGDLAACAEHERYAAATSSEGVGQLSDELVANEIIIIYKI